MEKDFISLSKREVIDSSVISLPASKSINNRLLVISELAGGITELENSSNARDTQLMTALIKSQEHTIDAKDAGTTFRFLTAYFAAKGQPKVLTGTDRMKQRPIGILIESLQELGAEIKYLEREGYPPLSIEGFVQNSNTELKMRGDISSQFISAILMIVPSLNKELTIQLKGKINSRPYINMTIELMRDFGAQITFTKDTIHIKKQSYQPLDRYWVEPDWSAASYWYSLLGIYGKGTLFMPGLKKDSLQGDSKIAEIMESLGVVSEFSEQGVKLSVGPVATSFTYDFSDCPDLAQTVAVLCAVKGIHCEMTGLESLKIKETDRIAALQSELEKFGVTLIEEDDTWILKGDFQKRSEVTTINTFEDHRMAMAFAPISLLCPIEISDPGVVKKSFPLFWDELEKATSNS